MFKSFLEFGSPGLHPPVFSDLVEPNPSLEQMKGIIARETKPTVPPTWGDSAAEFFTVLQNGWATDPAGRPSIEDVESCSKELLAA